MAGSLELIPLGGFPLVEPGDDLGSQIGDCLAENRLSLRAGDVLVIAQKVVSKAESRYVRLSDVKPGERARKLALDADKDPRLVQLILDESTDILRVRPGVIIAEHRNGYVHANAGIDNHRIIWIAFLQILQADSDVIRVQDPLTGAYRTTRWHNGSRSRFL